MPHSPEAPAAPERNGWSLYGWTEFNRQFAGLTAEVEELRRRDPDGYDRHPKAKLLAAVLRLVTDRIPRDPGAGEFRLGNTLGPEHRHWFRAKFFQRFRLFFRFHSSRRAIVYVWMNDETALRKHGSRRDPYSIFQRMLQAGSPPGDFAALLRESGALPVSPDARSAEQ